MPIGSRRARRRRGGAFSATEHSGNHAPPTATKPHAAPPPHPKIPNSTPPQPPSSNPLTPNQLTAARLLLAGHSVNAVAATLAVNPLHRLPLEERPPLPIRAPPPSLP